MLSYNHYNMTTYAYENRVEKSFENKIKFNKFEGYLQLTGLLFDKTQSFPKNLKLKINNDCWLVVSG